MKTIQEKEKQELLINHIVNQNYNGVKKLIQEGTKPPSKYKNKNIEFYISENFNLKIANLLLPTRKNWSFNQVIYNFFYNNTKNKDVNEDLNNFLIQNISKDQVASWFNFLIRKGQTYNKIGKDLIDKIIKNYNPDVLKLENTFKFNELNPMFGVVYSNNQQLWDLFEPYLNYKMFDNFCKNISSGKKDISSQDYEFLISQEGTNYKKIYELVDQDYNKSYLRNIKNLQRFIQINSFEDKAKTFTFSKNDYEYLDSLGIHWSYYYYFSHVKNKDILPHYEADDKYLKRSIKHHLLFSLDNSIQNTDVIKEFKDIRDAIYMSKHFSDVVKKFSKSSFSKNWKDEAGNNFAHYLILNSRLEPKFFAMHLEKNMNSENNNGVKPIDIARKIWLDTQMDEYTKIILEKNVKVNLKNSNNKLKRKI